MALQITEAPSAGAEPERQEFKPDLERIEIELLLEGIFRHYAFDFRAYAYASISRRLWKRINEAKPGFFRWSECRSTPTTTSAPAGRSHSRSTTRRSMAGRSSINR